MDAYVSMRSRVSELLSDIGSLLGDITEGPKSPAPGGAQPGDPGTLALDLQLTSFFKHLQGLKRRKEEPLSLAILALTKSGKSTLINSLLSSESMPMNNVPETARLVRIVHSPSSPVSLQEGDVQYKGAAAVRQRLQELNCAMRNHDPSASCSPPGSMTRRCSIGSATGSAAGAGAPDEIITIRAPIAALAEYDAGADPKDPPKLCLLDTPGPNEAGEEKLRFQVERLLDDVDAVLYLLDYTKLKTLEEESMLRRLKEINPRLLKRLAQRLFFVVNKVDSMHTSEGLGSDETREYVADLVTRQLGCEGFHLHPEQVILVSARNALLSRLVLSDQATEESMRRFLTLAFGYSATTSMRAPRAGIDISAVSGRGAVLGKRTPSAPAPIPPEQVFQAAHAMLEDSGIEDMEQQVLAFLYTHGAGVKLMALVDDIARLLHGIDNVALSCHACLKQNVATLKREAVALKGQLQGTLDTFDEVMRDTDVVAEEVTSEIRSHLSSLRGRLFTQIVQALDTDAASVAEVQRDATAAMARADTHAGSQAPSSRRWQNIREKVLSIFSTTAGSNSQDGGAAGGGGAHSMGDIFGRPAVARSRSKEEMAKLLTELHHDLMYQIHTDVTEFWHILETCTNARHSELLTRINANLELLSRRIETAVESRLEIRLQPVDLSLRMPTATGFHSDLQQLIGKGIVETRQKHIRVAERQYEERVLRHYGDGICKWGTYWETVPRSRTVVESYNVTMFELQPGEVSSHFIQMVDSAIESTEKALSHFVASFMQQQLGAARQEVQDYSERYLSAMSGALEAGSRGTEYRQAALSQVQGYMDKIGDLKAKLAVAQAEAELQVPHIQDAVPYEELDLDMGSMDLNLGMGSAEELVGAEDEYATEEDSEAVGLEGSVGGIGLVGAECMAPYEELGIDMGGFDRDLGMGGADDLGALIPEVWGAEDMVGAGDMGARNPEVWVTGDKYDVEERSEEEVGMEAPALQPQEEVTFVSARVREAVEEEEGEEEALFIHSAGEEDAVAEEDEEGDGEELLLHRSASSEFNSCSDHLEEKACEVEEEEDTEEEEEDHEVVEDGEECFVLPQDDEGLLHAPRLLPTFLAADNLSGAAPASDAPVPVSAADDPFWVVSARPALARPMDAADEARAAMASVDVACDEDVEETHPHATDADAAPSLASIDFNDGPFFDQATAPVPDPINSNAAMPAAALVAAPLAPPAAAVPVAATVPTDTVPATTMVPAMVPSTGSVPVPVPAAAVAGAVPVAGQAVPVTPAPATPVAAAPVAVPVAIPTATGPATETTIPVPVPATAAVPATAPVSGSSVSTDSGRFDYSTGFALAMSTSGLLNSQNLDPEETEEWMLIEGSGSSSSEDEIRV